MSHTNITTTLIKNFRILYVLIGLILFSNHSSAQNKLNLSRLIFEPVLLTDAVKAKSSLSEIENNNSGTESISSQTISRKLDIDQYEQALSKLEETEGPFSENLAEQLGSLGRLYSENGNYSQAITSLKNAQHIIRVNHGLFTLHQLEFVEDLATNYDKLGDFENQDKIREYLFYFQQKNYTENQPKMLAAKLAWANWNIQAFHNIYQQPGAPLFNSNNPNLSADDYILVHDTSNNTYAYVPRNNFYGTGAASSTSPAINMRTLVEPRLLLAQEIYISALQHTQSELQADELRKKLANIAFIVKQQVDSLNNIDNKTSLNSMPLQSRNTSHLITTSYSSNLIAFEEKVLSLKHTPNTSASVLAQALLELADWHLLFDHSRLAFPIYQEAYTVLVNAGKTESEISKILLPKTPLPLPTFSAQAFSSSIYGLEDNAASRYKGFIDIRLNINKQGNNRRIKVLESSEDTPKQIRVTLLDYLRTQKTRPTLINGQAVEQADIHLRFYYTY